MNCVQEQLNMSSSLKPIFFFNALHLTHCGVATIIRLKSRQTTNQSSGPEQKSKEKTATQLSIPFRNPQPLITSKTNEDRKTR